MSGRDKGSQNPRGQATHPGDGHFCPAHRFWRNPIRVRAVRPLKAQTSNLQIEIALAGLASKIVVAAIATAGRPQTGDHFIVYPATGALEIASPYRHEAAEAFQCVVRSMKPSFYFDLCCFDCRKLTLKVSKIVLRVHS
jgi:hypothetical protein